MKAVILYLNEEKPFSEYSFLLPNISQERRERIELMGQNGDRIRSLFAELLARYEVSEQLGTDFCKIEFGKNDFGKPYVVGADGYDFSVSHSARAVAFAGVSSHVGGVRVGGARIGGARVGVDVELISKRRKTVSGRFFAENEIKFIEQSVNGDAAFFEIWTKKEAYSKMLGKGLAAGFRSFDVTCGELGCEFYTEISDGYAFSVCSEEIPAEILKITETEFLKKLSEKLNFTIY